MAPHPLEVADGVANGVNPHVAHMQPTRWVREHGEDVELLPGALSMKNRRVILCRILLSRQMIFF